MTATHNFGTAPIRAATTADTFKAALFFASATIIIFCWIRDRSLGDGGDAMGNLLSQTVSNSVVTTDESVSSTG
jgi:hypothetical protein